MKTAEPKQTDMKQDQNEWTENLSQLIQSSELKTINTERDSYCWEINDKETLSKLKNNQYSGTIISDAFKLFKVGYKWFFHLKLTGRGHKAGTQYNSGNRPPQAPSTTSYIRISVGYLSCNKSIVCKTTISVLPINKKVESCWSYASVGRGGSYLEFERIRLKKLNKIAIRIDMELIGPDDDILSLSTDAQCKKALNEDVKKWLYEDVELNQYEKVFIMNGVDDMDIVKSLKEEHLNKMGISMIGHQIKILNSIELLK